MSTRQEGRRYGLRGRGNGGSSGFGDSWRGSGRNPLLIELPLLMKGVLARIYEEDLTGTSGIADSMTTISEFMEVA